jgi:hypothetical protein
MSKKNFKIITMTPGREQVVLMEGVGDLHTGFDNDHSSELHIVLPEHPDREHRFILENAHVELLNRVYATGFMKVDDTGRLRGVGYFSDNDQLTNYRKVMVVES